MPCNSQSALPGHNLQSWLWFALFRTTSTKSGGKERVYRGVCISYLGGHLASPKRASPSSIGGVYKIVSSTISQFSDKEKIVLGDFKVSGPVRQFGSLLRASSLGIGRNRNGLAEEMGHDLPHSDSVRRGACVWRDTGGRDDFLLNHRTGMQSFRADRAMSLVCSIT